MMSSLKDVEEERNEEKKRDYGSQEVVQVKMGLSMMMEPKGVKGDYHQFFTPL
jgi:hypothetical protein